MNRQLEWAQSDPGASILLFGESHYTFFSSKTFSPFWCLRIIEYIEFKNHLKLGAETEADEPPEAISVLLCLFCHICLHCLARWQLSQKLQEKKKKRKEKSLLLSHRPSSLCCGTSLLIKSLWSKPIRTVQRQEQCWYEASRGICKTYLNFLVHISKESALRILANQMASDCGSPNSWWYWKARAKILFYFLLLLEENIQEFIFQIHSKSRFWLFHTSSSPLVN